MYPGEDNRCQVRNGYGFAPAPGRPMALTRHSMGLFSATPVCPLTPVRYSDRVVHFRVRVPYAQYLARLQISLDLPLFTILLIPELAQAARGKPINIVPDLFLREVQAHSNLFKRETLIVAV